LRNAVPTNDTTGDGGTRGSPGPVRSGEAEEGEGAIGSDALGELSAALSRCNDMLRERCRRREELEPGALRRALADEGMLVRLTKADGAEMRELFAGGPLAGVDGSVNLWGGPYPHYVGLLRAVARSTSGAPPVVLAEAHTPLHDSSGPERGGADADRREREARLARLELRAAALAMGRYEPAVLLLDGPLVRFHIEAAAEFDELCACVEGGPTLVAGIIESVGTRLVAEALFERLPGRVRGMYDRELLFGVLRPGEAVVVPEAVAKPGLRTALARLSRDPAIIGVDVPRFQADRITELLRILFSLTPESGRGMPLWLDIVDREARITNRTVEVLVDACLDADVRQVLLSSKRAQRPY